MANYTVPQLHDLLRQKQESLEDSDREINRLRVHVEVLEGMRKQAQVAYIEEHSDGEHDCVTPYDHPGGITRSCDILRIKTEALNELAGKLVDINEYCQQNKIGTWGGSATEALIESHKALTEELQQLKTAHTSLASEMVFEGNSVHHWRDKAVAYKECAILISKVNEYCHQNKIGTWGGSATEALIESHKALTEKLASQQAVILEMVRDEHDMYGIGNMGSQWSGDDIATDIEKRLLDGGDVSEVYKLRCKWQAGILGTMLIETKNCTPMRRGPWLTKYIELQRGALGEPELCEDEGCPHHGTPHVCVSRGQPWPKEEQPDGTVVDVDPEDMGLGHQWDVDGERCLACGDKDWMATTHCSGRKGETK